MNSSFSTLLKQTKKEGKQRGIALDDLFVQDALIRDAEKAAAIAVKEIMQELKKEFDKDDK